MKSATIWVSPDNFESWDFELPGVNFVSDADPVFKDSLTKKAIAVRDVKSQGFSL